jgi:1,4-dihydroxy-2-naphthoyl-CoA synthase
VTEWRPSGPEPGNHGPGILSRAAQIAINRPEVRNASRPASLFELRSNGNLPVIILTATSGPDGVSPGRR